MPFYQAQRPLPATSGTPASVQQVPTVQQSGVSDQGPTALEQSLTAFPRALQQTGEAMTQLEGLRLQTEELKSKRQQAQDVLDAKTTLQEYRQSLQARYSTLQEGDYKDLAPKTLEEGKFLIAEMGRQLTPQARALFNEDAEETLSTIQQHALGEYGRRRDQHASYTLTREVQQFQEAYTQAANPYDRQVVLGQFDDFLQRSAATGLFQGAALADIRKKTMDSVALQGVQNAIVAEPQAMFQQLLAQAKGKPTREDLPTAPPERLAELTQQAFQTQQQRLGQDEHAERVADYRWAKKQEEEAAGIRAELSEILPTPDNVGKYQTILATVNRKAQGDHPVLSPTAQREFTNEIQSLRAAALKPRDTDDPTIERKLTFLIDAADNDQQYEIARSMVVQNAGMLKPDTMKSFLSTIRERKTSGHYSQLPGVKEGFRIIMGGDITEGTFLAMLRGGMKEDQQWQLRHALETYRGRISTLAATSRDQANVEAPGIATQIAEEYLIPRAKESKLKTLPLPLRGPDGKSGIRDEAEVDRILQNDPNLTDALRWRRKQQWLDWYKTGPAAPASGQPTAPSTGRQKVAQ